MDLRGTVMPFAAPVPPATLHQGSQGEQVKTLQRILGGIEIDGRFGPKTRTAVIAFQRNHQMLPDGVVGRMTWAALTA